MKLNQKKSNAIIYLCFFAAGVLLFIIVNYWLIPAVRSRNATNVASSRIYDKMIAKEAVSLFENEDALYSYVKKFGPQETVLRLHALSAQFGDCRVAPDGGQHASVAIPER